MFVNVQRGVIWISLWFETDVIRKSCTKEEGLEVEVETNLTTLTSLTSLLVY